MSALALLGWSLPLLAQEGPRPIPFDEPKPPPPPAEAPTPTPSENAGEGEDQAQEPAVGEAPAAQLAGATASAPSASWKLDLGGLAAYESRALFASTSAQGDFSGRLRASLDRNLAWPRFNLNLRGAGALVRYLRLNQLNTFGYEGEARGTLAVSRTVVLSTSQSSKGDLTRNFRNLTDAGLLLEQVYARAYLGRGGLEWRAGKRVTARVQASYDQYWFDSPTLVGSSETAGSATLDIVKGGHFSPGYELLRHRRNSTAGTAELWHHPFVIWTSPGQTGLRAELAFGYVYLQAPTGIENATPAGSANLGYRHRRHYLTAGYSRRLSPSYGLGVTTINSSASLAHSYAWSPRFSAGFYGTGFESRDPIDARNVYKSYGAGATASWRVSPRVTAAPTYSFYRFAQAGQAPLYNHSFTLSITHEQVWR